MLSKQSTGVIGLSLLLVLSGCTSITSSSSTLNEMENPTETDITTITSTHQMTTTSQTSATTTTSITAWPPVKFAAVDGPQPYPEPPANLSVEAIRRVTERHEFAYVYNTLAMTAGAENVSVSDGAATTVLDRQHGGFFATVRLGYSVERDLGETHSIFDGTTEATYFVNETVVWRVDAEQPVRVP